MEIFKILVAGVVATSLMTIFSYGVSIVRSSQFREPQLLNILINRSRLFNFKLSKTSKVGWGIHYFIGLIFILIYDIIWKNTQLQPTLTPGIIFGFITGIIGVIGWKIMLSLHNNPPNIKWIEYYLQLIVAHVIFWMGAVWVYQMW